MRLIGVVLAVFAAAAAGAPPGYVDDAQCASCHAKIVRSYHDVGMSKSFYRPRQDDAIENFDKLPFRHAKSGDVMELRWRNGRLVFRRWRERGGQAPSPARTGEAPVLHLFEQPVDWILGSGHHARTYLYQTPNGELYQLPLAWYSQTKEWGMAPGYDRRDHEGVLRRARHECLFCHNAYPGDRGQGTGDRGYWSNQGVPVSLPEGIGCQRCHGPGAEHVARASAGAENAEVRAAIVTPTRLDARLRNDVCYECHMQPSVAIPGIRRFGRDIYSFRPGQVLPDYLLHLDIADAELARGERFEINHHPYRLEQSRCFRESEGRLSCLSCHDPHRKVPEAQRAAHYRAVCMQCHASAHRANEDCVACHMPKRRTQDVVRVTMTDHRIRRTGGPELLAPRQERDPIIEGVEILDPRRAPADAELYRTVAAVRAGSTPAARHLEQLLAAKPSPDIESYFDLAAAQLRQKRYADVEATARLILARVADHPLALEWLGLARANRGFRDEGIELLRKAAALDPQRVETHYNLGLHLMARGDRDDAIRSFERAVAGRPNFVLAWFHLGNARAAAGERDAALVAWRRALDIDPHFKRAASAVAEASR